MSTIFNYLKSNDKGVLVFLHIQPNSSKNQIVGVHGDRLKVKLKSPPVDGKANQCLIDYLSECFEISKNKVHIIRGEQSREKTVLLEKLSIETVTNYLKNAQKNT